MKGKSGKGGKDCYKKGGAVNFAELKNSGGGSKPRKAHGVSAKARLDKKSRGGKMPTAGSPLSGAAPKGIGGRGTGENN